MAAVLRKAAKKVILSPTSLVGSPAQYMTTLNQDHRDYNFSQTGNVITVALQGQNRSILDDAAQWSMLNETTSAQEAETGLLVAFMILRLINKFMITILPFLSHHTKIPMEVFQNAGVELDMDSPAYQVTRQYPSYVEIRTYFTVKLQQASTRYQFVGLPK